MRLLRHTGVCRGFGCTKQSRRRTKATTSPYFHPFGVARARAMGRLGAEGLEEQGVDVSEEISSSGD
jgi:hypothetical protein